MAGHCCGGSELFLSLSDMMKLGMLYLNNGCIDGKNYFDDDWVKESTKVHFNIEKTEDLWSYGYDYFWCIFPDGQIYRANGVFGQDTIIIPKIECVIGLQCAGTNYNMVKDIINKHLLIDLDIV